MWHWEHQQVALARSCRLITPDLLGSGLSEKPERTYSPAFLLDTLRTFMDTLHIQKAALIGSSMGAGLAIGMSLEHPDRVTKLGLIGGFPANILDNLQSSKTKQFITHRPALWLSKLGSRIFGRWSIKLILEEIIHDQALISRSSWNVFIAFAFSPASSRPCIHNWIRSRYGKRHLLHD